LQAGIANRFGFSPATESGRTAETQPPARYLNGEDHVKRPRKESSTRVDVSPKAAVIVGMAAPLIAVLQSPALAATGPIQRTDAIGGPMLDPPTMIATGAAIATIGAYRLMKLRGRKSSNE